jgi:hypothetical protein
MGNSGNEAQSANHGLRATIRRINWLAAGLCSPRIPQPVKEYCMINFTSALHYKRHRLQSLRSTKVISILVFVSALIVTHSAIFRLREESTAGFTQEVIYIEFSSNAGLTGMPVIGFLFL